MSSFPSYVTSSPFFISLFSGGILLLYHDLLERKKYLLKEIQNLKHRLASYPAGELICTKNRKYVTCMHSVNGVYSYIPKKDFEFAKTLGEKKLFSASLEDLQRELCAVDAFLNCYQSEPSKVEQLLSQPCYQKVINLSFQAASEDLEQWSRAFYETNPSHRENLRHSCLSGHMVRSKSEALIDQTLFMHKIPFRYECALLLKDVTFYPDFTIRHPQSGKYFYWEHFGLMDSPSYSQQAFQKLNIYCQNSIIPTINLITTYETKDHPLTTQTIENIVQEYFVF